MINNTRDNIAKFITIIPYPSRVKVKYRFLKSNQKAGNILSKVKNLIIF